MQNPMTVHEGRPGVFKGTLLEESLYEQSHRRPHLSLDEVRPTFFRVRCTNRDETNHSFRQRALVSATLCPLQVLQTSLPSVPFRVRTDPLTVPFFPCNGPHKDKSKHHHRAI